MSNAVIVYGSRMLAGMLYYDSLRHPDFKIEAFVQDEPYLDKSGFYLGLPQVGFKMVTENYPTSKYDIEKACIERQKYWVTICAIILAHRALFLLM